MAALGSARWRRKMTTLALTTLLVAAMCVCLMKQTEGYQHNPRADEEDGEEEEDDDEFDFISSKLDSPPKRSIEEASCDASAGQCAAPSIVQSVVKRGLVTTKPRVKDILHEHARVETESSSRFSGEALGYVTPWNGRGYDFARQFRHKFDYISPVWLQIREDGATQRPVVTGTHDIDRQWVKDVRGSDGRGPRIVPRVVYERNRLSGSDVPIIIDALLDLAEKEAFDGFVFEIPVSQGTMDLLVRVGTALRQAKLLFLVVLIRSSNDGRLPVTPELLDQLLPVVHRFTMNAYDYHTPGPNAPLEWIDRTLQRFRPQDRAKILMGLPFYGYDNHDAIVGATYLEQLREHDGIKIRWDAAAHECVHQYDSDRDGKKHTTFYPCLQFLQDRLQLFRASEVAGAAIWELGQGLAYFYDVL